MIIKETVTDSDYITIKTPKSTTEKNEKPVRYHLRSNKCKLSIDDKKKIINSLYFKRIPNTPKEMKDLVECPEKVQFLADELCPEHLTMLKEKLKKEFGSSPSFL